MIHILQEFQQASGTVIAINAIRKEVHLLGFHGRTDSNKSLNTKSNHAARLRWCRTLRNWTVDEWKQVLWSYELGFNLYYSDDRI
ncbi:transposable element tcb1 transposase [Trichonephila clavipes]|nr:transposable element tcb1 transposase [Trichonephila clavipes]